LKRDDIYGRVTGLACRRTYEIDSLRLLVFFFSSLVAVFIGPLEAVLAMGLYWLFEPKFEDIATE
jgi:hypothetical protein